MVGRLIGLIYFYLVSVIALILLVIGIHSSVTFVLNITQYDQYPPRYIGEDCGSISSPYYKSPYGIDPAVPNQATLSAEEKAEMKKQCETRVDFERKQHKLEDIRNAIVFTLVGAVLFLIHFPQARKLSQEK